ncbi:polysaccharide biosynthesis tyrosine autokinase [candidate division KSB3 bacterium]|uniref:non-specific protein-tyrosine kinase n=1 Tax=candidate division KSB3 bacterium TaxID=2044937 RepID=A0A9D5JSH1_9BACT|nr:polysaccharide biosynthesis tyrosine autokinase [candidate division KSB3 bacterium]MBD3323378.1 polysaccharide biosynthesis tyrosine autokinase [candidate division KSB3 bacterium]
MFRDDFRIQDYLRIIKKRQWVIITFLTIVVISVTISSFLRAPVYKSTARILIEKETPNVLSFKEVLALDTADTDYYQTQYTILKSRTLARAVLEKLGMMEQARQDDDSSFSVRGLLTSLITALGLRQPPSESAQIRAREEDAINNFLNNIITIEPIKGSRLVDVSALSTNPELATQIANTLVEVYIQQNLEAKLAASKDAVGWLADQLTIAQQKVADSETALQQYKEQHGIISFEDRQNIIMQKLSELNTAVNNARIKRIAIETQYKQIQEYLALDDTAPTTEAVKKLETISQVINNPLIQQLKVELSNLETELSELRKKFRSKHPNVIALRSQIASVRERIDAEIQRIIGSITNEYELALAQEQEMTTALEDQKREALNLNQKAIAYGVLQRDVESNKRVYDALLQRTKETSVTEQLETSNIRIIDRATVPNYAIAPRKKLNIFLSMVVGLVLGTLLAFFFEYIDNSIKTPDDIKQYLDIPFLGFIPKVSSADQDNMAVPKPKLHPVDTVVAVAPKSTASEAYRSLRTNVMFSSLEHGPIILVTSAGPTEGKSITVANLGITMAQSGSKTLIIDCDLRKPRMHKIFNLSDHERGLTDMIANLGTNGTKITVKRTKIPNLDLIPCGNTPPNPSELLSSERTRLLIQALSKKYDKILIDSPPVNVVTDPVILSQIVSGIIVIIRAGETGRDVIRRALDQLRDVKAQILGGVLNGVDVQRDNYYYYSYYNNYYYHEKEDADEDAQSIGGKVQKMLQTKLTSPQKKDS